MAEPDFELWNSILQTVQSGIADLKADMAIVKENTSRTDIRLKIVEAHMTGFMSSARYLENEINALQDRSSRRVHPPS